MRVRIAKKRWFDIEPGQRWANRYNKRVLTVLTVTPDQQGEEFNTRITHVSDDGRAVARSPHPTRVNSMYAHTLVRNWVLLPSEQ